MDVAIKTLILSMIGYSHYICIVYQIKVCMPDYSSRMSKRLCSYVMRIKLVLHAKSETVNSIHQICQTKNISDAIGDSNIHYQ